MVGPAPEISALKDRVRARLRGEALLALARRLHPLLLLAFCLALAVLLVPHFRAVPLWGPVLVLLLALPWRPRPRPVRVRILDEGAGLQGLLCAALEAPTEHPYAPELARRARAALAAPPVLAVAPPVRRLGRLGLLYAFLAFLLALRLAGPMPWERDVPGSRPSAQLPPRSAPGEGGPDGGGQGGVGSEAQSRPAASRPVPRPDPAAAKPDAGGAPPPVPPLRPEGREEVALTPPVLNEGPKRPRQVVETEGGEPPASAAQAPPGGKDPGGEEAARRAAALERAAERALGDGVMTPGEAWLARRQAEGLRQ